MIKELRFTESIVSPKEPKVGELMSPLFRYNAPALLVEIIISSLSLGKPKVSSFFNTVDINIFSFKSFIYIQTSYFAIICFKKTSLPGEL